MFRRFDPSLLTVLLTIVLSFESSRAAEVQVTLVDGRTLVGEVDARSDTRQLWLRRSDATTTILRSISWTQIAAMRAGDQPLATERLRESLRTEPQPVLQRAPTVSAPGPGTLRTWRIPGVSTTAETQSTATIRSLELDADVANWDADVEADGLVLNFAALDEFGSAVAVDGTLEVELVGERLPPYSRGNSMPTLGRWVLAVGSAEVERIGGNYRVRLGFQALHPDFQLYLPRYAMVHARLSVPGRGTFEASRDGLSLRGFTPVRDRLEAASGTRFIPNERTGRGRRESSQTAP